MDKKQPQTTSITNASIEPEATSYILREGEAEYQLNTTLPNIMFDSMRIAVRSDGLILLGMYTSVPNVANRRFEAFRGITTMAHARQIVDVLTRSLDYYPERKGEAD